MKQKKKRNNALYENFSQGEYSSNVRYHLQKFNLSINWICRNGGGSNWIMIKKQTRHSVETKILNPFEPGLETLYCVSVATKSSVIVYDNYFESTM